MQKKHIADIIFSRLSGKKEGVSPSPAPKAAERVKRIFLSDWEVRRLYNKERNELAVPANAILSPLSMDWLEYQNVRIIRK